MAEIILFVIFIAMVWGLFYYVARALGDYYDNKPLKYVELKTNKNNMDTIKCPNCGKIYDPSLPHYCSNSGENFDKSTEAWRLTKRMEKLESETGKNKPLQEERPISWENKWWTPYIVAGIILGASQNFMRNYGYVEKLIVIALAIGAGFLYSPLKSKIKIKNRVARVFITFLILEIIVALLVGLIGLSVGSVGGLIDKSDNQQKMVVCQGLCNFNPYNKVWRYKAKYFQTQDQCLNYCITQ